LSAGLFPLQTWSSSAQKDITQRTITFLKGQKYEKRPNFDQVASPLSSLIEASELITVILISSGDCKIRGTRFDDRINAAYQQFHDQQQKARMPFVTVLRARHGQVADYIVNTPPWPLQVPRLIEESKSVEEPHGKPIEAVHTVPPTTLPPLIVSGKKPQPEPAPVPKPEAVPAKAEPPTPLVSGTVTNEPTVVRRIEPAARPAEVAKVEPAPVVLVKPAAEPMPKPVAEPKPVSEPKAETVKAPEAKAAEPSLAKPEVVPLPPASKPEPAPAIIEQPKPSPAPEVKTWLVFAPAVIPKALPAVIPSVVVDQVTTSNSSSHALPPSSRPAPPTQSATAAPGESFMSTRNVWIAAVLLAVVAVVFASLLTRRSRTAPQGSLITRSFEQKKGP